MYCTNFKTATCNLTLVGDNEGLSNIYFNSFNMPESYIYNKEFFCEAINQLQEYFNGNRKIFDLKLNPKGTDFQKKVWLELSKIPYAETRNYQDIAEKIGNIKACRAVGMANNKNPLPIVVPCHRVIGKNGKLVGFAGGIELKQKLLDLERDFS